MANFFKEYQKEIKEKELAKSVEEKRIEYSRGQVVHINPMYDENRNGKRYFVDYLTDGFVLLADNKKDAMNGYGLIYSACVIENKR